MKTTPRRKRGFTLVELTLAVALGAVVGAMLLALLNQQVAFLQVYRAQSFLIDEAPVVNMYVSRLVTRADKVTLHVLTDSTLADGDGQEGANAIRLYYRQPDGTWKSAVMAYHAGERALTFHPEGASPSPVVGDAAWTVTRLQGEGEIRFSTVDHGIVRMTLKGPQGEEIFYDTYPSYSGTL